MKSTMLHNDTVIRALETWGLDYEIHCGKLWINRTSMMQGSPKSLREDEVYDSWIHLIRALLPPDLYVNWAGRDDEALGLEVCER